MRAPHRSQDWKDTTNMTENSCSPENTEDDPAQASVDSQTEQTMSSVVVDAQAVVQVLLPASNDDEEEEEGSPNASRGHVQAAQLAVDARQRGTELIRDHLRHHLEQNPDSSFVTWIATLHPENAEVSIDPRFFVENNPWQTVFEEVTNLEGQDVKDEVFVTHAVPVPNEVVVPKEATHVPPFVGLIDGVLGYALLLSALATTLAIELISLVLIVLKHGFHFVMNATRPVDLCHQSPWVVIQIVTLPLFFAAAICFFTFDLVLLILTFVSTLVVEILAVVACALIGLLNLNFRTAFAWHQTIRKLTHHVRWACRSHWKGILRSEDSIVAQTMLQLTYYSPMTRNNDDDDETLTWNSCWEE